MELVTQLDRIKAESDYYKAEFADAHLSIETDGAWMAQLAGYEFDEVWLGKINELIGIGSLKLDEVDEELQGAVYEARADFFEGVLGLDDSQHPLHEAYVLMQERQPNLVPVAAFIETQRKLWSEGPDIVEVLRNKPKCLIPHHKLLDSAAEETTSLELIAESSPLVETDVALEVALDSEFDGEWLSRLAGRELSAAEIDDMDQLATSDDPNLRNADREHIDKIIAVRERFFGDMLGWSNDEHPLHLAYERIKNDRRTLMGITSFIGAQRMYADRDIDIVSIARVNEKILNSATSANTYDRLEFLESLGLSPKAIYEGSPKTCNSSNDRIGRTYGMLESFKGLDPQAIINETPAILMISTELLEQKIRYLLSIGATIQTINKNSNMLNLSLRHMHNNVRVLSEHGLDVARIVNRNRYALGSNAELLEQRIRAIKDMGLDAGRVIDANATLVNSDPALVRSKLLLIKSILRYFGSDATAEEVANSNAMILTRNKQKMRSTARILKDIADPEYVASYGGRNFDYFVMKSLDAHVAAIAEKRTTDGDANGYVTITEIRRKDRQIPSRERRTYSLDILADTTARRAIGSRVVDSYLTYQPLTEKELANYPELAELAL